jgi:hypothetical protein
MKATTPKVGIMAISSTSSKMINNLGVATNSHTTPPGDQEAMTKATTRPRHIGRLANHHHVYSSATTGTVAPRLPMLRCGHKTTITTMPGRALHQDKTAFLANQVS